MRLPAAPRAPAIVAALVAVLVAAGCETGVGPITSEPVTGASQAPIATRVPEPTAAGDPLEAAATGPWRRVPFLADAAFGTAQEAGCRTASEDIGKARRVLVDIRGENRILVVFVGSSKAFLCVASLDDPSHPTEVDALPIPDGALADDGIDLAFYEETGTGSATTSFAVGRVGPTPAYVIAGFVNETFVFGTKGGGWYAMWWPTTVACQGISAADHRHVVLSTAHAPCEPGSSPPSSP